MIIVVVRNLTFNSGTETASFNAYVTVEGRNQTLFTFLLLKRKVQKAENFIVKNKS